MELELYFGEVKTATYAIFILDLSGKEKSTPLLDYIKEKANRKRQDREQRKESRRKREEERKKNRDEERKKRREKQAAEIKEGNLRGKEKKEPFSGKFGAKNQSKSNNEIEKSKPDRSERNSRQKDDSMSTMDTSGRRGSRGNKGSRHHKEDSKEKSAKRENSTNNKFGLKDEKELIERDKPVSSYKDIDDANAIDYDSDKSGNKYGSKSSIRSKEDSKRAKDVKDIKTREGNSFKSLTSK